MRCLVVIAVALIGGLPRPATAEDVASYEVEGEADAVAGDPRVAALDEAFARATTLALGELLDAETRKANKPAIDRELVGRARLWVIRFAVTKDHTNDGRRQLTVVVRVDRDKMRGRLDELGIANAPPGAAPQPTSRAIILMRISERDRTRASFGTSGTSELPGMAALAASLRKAGLSVKRAPTTGTVRATGELPVTDDEADAIISDAKVEAAAIVGVKIGEPVAVHGVDATAALVTAELKMVGRAVPAGRATAVTAARGDDPSVVAAAIDRAVIDAASDVIAGAPSGPKLGPAPGYQGDDTPFNEPGVVLVRIPAKTPFPLVSAELKYLAGAKGVSSATLRRVSPAGYVLGIATAESVQRIASIARKSPASGATSQVKVVGDIVEVTLTGSP